jgi:hypothetical protein
VRQVSFTLLFDPYGAWGLGPMHRLAFPDSRSL